MIGGQYTVRWSNSIRLQMWRPLQSSISIEGDAYRDTTTEFAAPYQLHNSNDTDLFLPRTTLSQDKTHKPNCERQLLPSLRDASC